MGLAIFAALGFFIPNLLFFLATRGIANMTTNEEIFFMSLYIGIALLMGISTFIIEKSDKKIR